MTTYAVDFETYYDVDLSVTVQGTVNYANQTDIYLVSIYGPDVEYVGPVSEAPWVGIDGHHWVSHNAAFDVAVYNAACDKGLIPHVPFLPDYYEPDYPFPEAWDCTADMMAFLGYPRSLAGGVLAAYNVTLDKAMRSSAKGKHWPDDFKPEDRDRMKQYAMRDAEWCWQLWDDWSELWPEHERELSRITRKRGHEGVTVDIKALGQDLQKITYVMEQAKAKIPWSSSGIILSHTMFAEYCKLHALPIPASLAKDSEEANSWDEQYGDEHPILRARREYVKANRMYKIIEGMIDRAMPNGRMCFGLKYFGAHTGRWSGSDGVNMQNPNRDAVFGVDIRGHFKAAPGKKFVIADYSQIEPRCAAWLVEDAELLNLIRTGHGIYEAFALATGMWEGEKGTLKTTNKDIYLLAKAQVLALGYGCGPKKFIKMAKMYAGLDISLEESKRIVYDFRSRNPTIVSAWNRLERDMVKAAARKEPYSISLPSGRFITYRNVKVVGRKEGGTTIMATQGYTKDPVYVWGGLLFENAVSGTARDILANAILSLERVGVPVLWSAHDEVVCEVDENFNAESIRFIMTVAPEWMQGIPLEVEIVESKHYLK